MTAPVALQSNNITAVGVGVIIALIVIGAVLSFVITALVGRIVVLAVVVVLGVIVWVQRTDVQNRVNDCHLSASFFGVHVNAPKDVRQHCTKK